MTKQGIIGLTIGGVLVGGVLAFFIVQTKNQQVSTQEQLDALKKQMATATAQAVHPTQAPGVPVAPNAAIPVQDGSLMARQRAAHEYLAEGYRLLNTHDPQNAAQAAQIFQEGLEKVDGRNVLFFNGLGRAQLAAGKFDESLEAFRKGREIDPRRAELASGQGWVFWNLKKYPEAKQAWENAVALDPNSEEAWRALSWIYMAVREFEKSRQGFVILLKIDPERRDWIFGLTMARASNPNIEQIRSQFKGMPDPEAFKPPVSRPSGA